MNARPRLQEHRDLKDSATIVKSMDIKHMNVDQIQIGHQTSRQRYKPIENPTIGITTQGIVITIVKSMDMLLRIPLEHISEVTTVDG